MKKAIWTGLAAWLMAVSLSPPLSRPLLAEGNKAAAAPSMPKVGDVAPDFKLQYFDGTDLKNVTLSQYRGQKNVIVAFYIFAFTGG
ncbi:MAG: redoxin domain-containing protein [Acidobacteriia bacterium]|nr:redoxin domain-containing protein [Terriglobia bacterium]